MNNATEVRLTRFSHGAGCGCKIAPNVLEQILTTNSVMPGNNRLLVGNDTRDDAAVYDLQNGTALIATTDFFMPIVDDPYDFGRIAAANAISDVYAMGGKPILAIAILGWPVNTLGPDIAQKVIEGGRSICQEAGIVLAGGHSIDSPEPIFGLAVNGLINIKNIKQNNTATPGDVLFLTKKLGVGILTTAEKKGVLKEEHKMLAARQMMQLNTVGEALGKITGVTAMTDVTGFGLLGHLMEMCMGSSMSAMIDISRVPLITSDLIQYINLHAVPGGTGRNLESYGHNILFSGNVDKTVARIILADPQTSGGLLVAVAPPAVQQVKEMLQAFNLCNTPIGNITERQHHLITVQ